MSHDATRLVGQNNLMLEWYPTLSHKSHIIYGSLYLNWVEILKMDNGFLSTIQKGVRMTVKLIGNDLGQIKTHTILLSQVRNNKIQCA